MLRFEDNMQECHVAWMKSLVRFFNPFFEMSKLEDVDDKDGCK